MDARAHWEHVYATKGPEQLSWFQREATLSCELITRLAPDRESRILDVGAGASTLVDGLLNAGYEHLTVLDLAPAALRQSEQRLGAAAVRVNWLDADILTAPLERSAFDVWHDRAVFHFLTEAADRVRYVEQVRRALHPDGIVVVATFAIDGPVRCSGLDARRYSPDALHHEFGQDFRLVESRREKHVTPWGAVQAFTYCLCRYEPHEHVRDVA